LFYFHLKSPSAVNINQINKDKAITEATVNNTSFILLQIILILYSNFYFNAFRKQDFLADLPFFFEHFFTAFPNFLRQRR
jgi:hypothetical protein